MLTETGNASRPTKTEMKIIESFFRAMGYRTYHPGHYDSHWRQTLAFFQATVLKTSPTGWLDDSTKDGVAKFYNYLGSHKNPDLPPPKELGWGRPPTPSASSYSTGGYSGGYGGGGGGGAGPGGARAAPRSDAEIRDYINANFPIWAPFLSHAELGPLLMRAAREERDAPWLEAQVRTTQYYKSHSEAQRQWDVLRLTDRAEMQRLIDGRTSSIGNLNGNFGLGLTAAQLHKIAVDSLSLGWSDDQINDYLARYVTRDDFKRQGLVSDVYDQAHALGGEYFIGVSDGQALKFARQIISGDMTAENLQGFFVDQAKKTYAHLADQLDKGASMRQIFDPHRQEISRLLEVSPEEIDFTDQAWSKVVTYHDTDGKTRAMNLHEAADLARRDTRWKDTDNAKQSMTDMVWGLGEAFGALKR